MSTRRSWFMRDRPVVIWLMVALLVSLVHPFFAYSRWLMVHLVVLGAVTHAAMVWSVHFTEALLKTRPGSRSAASRRSACRSSGRRAARPRRGPDPHLAAHPHRRHAHLRGGRLARGHARPAAQAALPGRFRITVRYYIVAALLLPSAPPSASCSPGAASVARATDTAHGQLLVAHTMVNLLGWIGLTVLGTLVTLWPTMLRTRWPTTPNPPPSMHFPCSPVAGPRRRLAARRPRHGRGRRHRALPRRHALGLPPDHHRRAPAPPYAFPTLSAGAGLLWLPVGPALVGWSCATRGSWAPRRQLRCADDDLRRRLRPPGPARSAVLPASRRHRRSVRPARRHGRARALGHRPRRRRQPRGALPAARAEHWSASSCRRSPSSHWPCRSP